MPPQIKQAKLETLEAIIKEVEGMKKPESFFGFPVFDSKKVITEENKIYNSALSDLLTKLQAELTLLKNER